MRPYKIPTSDPMRVEVVSLVRVQGLTKSPVHQVSSGTMEDGPGCPGRPVWGS